MKTKKILLIPLALLLVVGLAAAGCGGPSSGEFPTNDITIIATGTMVYTSLEAAAILDEQGVSATVVNMHTLKPLDTLVVEKACKLSKLIVTVEEHSIIGGLGSAIAECKAVLKKAIFTPWP